MPVHHKSSKPKLFNNTPLAPGRAPWMSILLISCVALAYEILLTRLFAMLHWHHITAMVISLALLGYGASGTFLTLFQGRLQTIYRPVFLINALLFGASLIICFLLSQKVPLNPQQLAWDPYQIGYLATMYFILAIPFFLAANCVGLSLWRFHESAHKVYAFDLTGAGIGALAVILLLFLLSAHQALIALSILALTASAIAVLELGMDHAKTISITIVFAALSMLLLPADSIRQQAAEYKDLSQALATIGSRIDAVVSGPLGEITVVNNKKIPFRHAPGLSLASPVQPPNQLGVFLDGDSLGSISSSGNSGDMEYLEYLTSALPYQLLENPDVLILGAGGGSAVSQAKHFGAKKIDAVELNPQLIDLIQTHYRPIPGNIYLQPEVQVHIDEIRGFLDASNLAWNLIQLDLLDAFGTTAAGMRAQSESYLYTVEAFEAYLSHLRPNGLLAVTRWLRLPPRDSMKLVATARLALERNGVANPELNIAIIRGWKTSTLLVKNDPLSSDEIAAIKAFCHSRSFDSVYYPGMPASEANQYNLIDRPQFYEGVSALLGDDASGFIMRYKFDIAPVTDDRPYFFRFSKWQTVPELIALPAQAGLSQMDWGYWILIATLLQAIVLSLVVILLPLMVARFKSNSTQELQAEHLIYFLLIGVAFMFMEIAFLQKFLRFLNHPLYAVSVVLSGFLVFAGIGSSFSQRLVDIGRQWLPVPPIALAVMGITVFALLYLIALPVIFSELAGLSDGWRIAISLLLIAPLAFFMGVPFPAGLKSLATFYPHLVPWAWGFNGFASVISVILAVLLAMGVGFMGLVLLAVTLYLFAVVFFPRKPREELD